MPFLRICGNCTSSLAVSSTWHYCNSICLVVILASVHSRGYTFGFFRKTQPVRLIPYNFPSAASSAEQQRKGWVEGVWFLAFTTPAVRAPVRMWEERAGVRQSAQVSAEAERQMWEPCLLSRVSSPAALWKASSCWCITLACDGSTFNLIILSHSLRFLKETFLFKDWIVTVLFCHYVTPRWV